MWRVYTQQAYQRTGLVHEPRFHQAMLAFAKQMGKKACEVGDERGRGSLQLDVVILSGTHFIQRVEVLIPCRGRRTLRLFAVGSLERESCREGATRAPDPALCFPRVFPESQRPQLQSKAEHTSQWLRNLTKTTSPRACSPRTSPWVTATQGYFLSNTPQVTYRLLSRALQVDVNSAKRSVYPKSTPKPR